MFDHPLSPIDYTRIIPSLFREFCHPAVFSSYVILKKIDFVFNNIFCLIGGLLSFLNYISVITDCNNVDIILEYMTTGSLLM